MFCCCPGRGDDQIDLLQHATEGLADRGAVPLGVHVVGGLERSGQRQVDPRVAAAIGAELTLEDREFGGAIARISLPIVPTGSATDGVGERSIQAPIWRPQNG